VFLLVAGFQPAFFSFFCRLWRLSPPFFLNAVAFGDYFIFCPLLRGGFLSGSA
jgi:hypothetical protein